MKSTGDKIKGAANTAFGKTKKAVGAATDDKKMQGEGNLQRSKGEAQKMVGNVKDKIKSGARSLGDKIEHIAD